MDRFVFIAEPDGLLGEVSMAINKECPQTLGLVLVWIKFCCFFFSICFFFWVLVIIILRENLWLMHSPMVWIYFLFNVKNEIYGLY